MPPKRKNPTETVNTKVKTGSSGISKVVENDMVKYVSVSYVYVLTMKDYYHGDDYYRDDAVVGIYNSKSDAIAAAGDIKTDYGTFDEAIAGDMFDDCYEDHRKDAPDHGLLLKIGHKDVGEGDNVQLIIDKNVRLDMPITKPKIGPSSTTKAEDNDEILSYVYVLTMKDFHHPYKDRPDTIVGIYNSKNDAIAAAGNIMTYYGTFDKAIAYEYDDCYEDHRKDAPDHGLLLKIGHEDVEEGGNVQLIIEKRLKLDMLTKADDNDEFVSYVFVLIMKGFCLSDRDRPDTIVGIYDSKRDAIAAAGKIETDYGTFDEAIACDNFNDCYEDHRKDAPDHGLLLKIGHEDVGEGINVQLIIEKTMKLDVPTTKPKTKKKYRRNERYFFLDQL